MVLVFGICRPGMVIATVAHWLLVAGAWWMVVVEKHLGYLWFLAGYIVIAALLTYKLQRAMAERHRRSSSKPPLKKSSSAVPR